MTRQADEFVQIVNLICPPRAKRGQKRQNIWPRQLPPVRLIPGMVFFRQDFLKCPVTQDLSKWRLAAADDFFGANNFVAETFQNFHHADASARKQRVHETVNE